MLIDSCLICLKPTWKSDTICTDCLKVVRSLPLQARHQNDLVCYSLLNYLGVTKNLILECKKGKNPKLIRILTRELVEKVLSEIDLNYAFQGVIPIPPKIKGLEDHAFLIAKQVAKTLDLPLRPDILKINQMSNGVEQKELDIKGRAQVRFSKSKENEYVEGAGWILVDDVITTGLTLMAAHKVLGPRASCLALSLASRPYLL